MSFCKSNVSFSPDGQRIVYEGTGLVVVNIDGSNPVQITDGVGYHKAPDWHPDGSKIIFEKIPPDDPGNSDLYTVEPDGSNLTRLTDKDGDDRGPRWSPDGSKVLYTFASKLWIMDADGNNQAELSQANPIYSRSSAWSPDGSRIAMTRYISPAANEVGMMNSDGTNHVDISLASNDDFAGDW